MILRFYIFLLVSHTAAFSQQILDKNETPGNYTTIFWSDNHFNIELNEAYIKKLKDHQRAAIAYNITSVGTQCQWDGEKNKDESNLKCPLLSALNLGYQCSETHLSFLKKWFKKDKRILEQLEFCNKIESPSNQKQQLLELKMGTSKNTITIIYTAITYGGVHTILWTEESIFFYKRWNYTN